MLTTSESREEITVVRLSPQALKESLRKTLKAKTNVSKNHEMFRYINDLRKIIMIYFPQNLYAFAYQQSMILFRDDLDDSLLYTLLCKWIKLLTLASHNRHPEFHKSLLDLMHPPQIELLKTRMRKKNFPQTSKVPN